MRISDWSSDVCSSDLSFAFLFVFLSTAVSGLLGPTLFAGIQNACDPRSRARAVAFALCFVTIGSYAVMPVVVGALSDLLTPRFGVQSQIGRASCRERVCQYV